LDQALWSCPGTAGAATRVAGYERLGLLPFDHDRQLCSVLVNDPRAVRS